MTEQEMLTQIYKLFHPSLLRLGPGDDQSTRQALNLIPQDIRRPGRRILDLGCGNGAQTICLARELRGEILAVDTHQPFLDELTKRAAAAGCGERVRILCADMASIRPEQGPFDLIWCEGAIYNIGFEKGLRHCRTLLDGGYFALTDLNWLGSERPEACREFFERVQLPVLDIDGNLDIIRTVGFETIGHFALPASSWWNDFYNPLAKRLQELRRTQAGDAALMEVVAGTEAEIEVYRRHSAAYGYVFYVMKA